VNLKGLFFPLSVRESIGSYNTGLHVLGSNALRVIPWTIIRASDLGEGTERRDDIF
jgi:hypothetical protein